MQLLNYTSLEEMELGYYSHEHGPRMMFLQDMLRKRFPDEMYVRVFSSGTHQSHHNILPFNNILIYGSILFYFILLLVLTIYR